MSFKTPEHLRFRRQGHPLSSNPGEPFGCFMAQESDLLPAGLKMIASNGFTDKEDIGFEHVSISHIRDSQTPSWEEMRIVAGLFWDDEDCLVQYRPPKSDYVNVHRGCLHWWRWKQGEIPMPPKECV